MRLNLSSQIVLNKVPVEFYKPKTTVEYSEISRMEKIHTDIFASMAEGASHVADKIEAGTCEVDDEELPEIANSFIHRKLNAEQLSHHLGVSRSTITRMVTDGRIPRPYKTLGGDKYWW